MMTALITATTFVSTMLRGVNQNAEPDPHRVLQPRDLVLEWKRIGMKELGKETQRCARRDEGEENGPEIPRSAMNAREQWRHRRSDQW